MAVPLLASREQVVPCNVSCDVPEACVKRARQAFVLLFAASFIFAAGGNAQQIDPKTYGGMKWRLIGPFRGGRVTTVAGVPSQPNAYYFGAVGGGVWKTSDGGNTWDPLFEKQSVSSIGAVAVSDSDPNVIYAGRDRKSTRLNSSHPS